MKLRYYTLGEKHARLRSGDHDPEDPFHDAAYRKEEKVKFMAIQKLAHVALQRLYSRNEHCEFYFMRRVAVRSVATHGTWLVCAPGDVYELVEILCDDDARSFIHPA